MTDVKKQPIPTKQQTPVAETVEEKIQFDVWLSQIYDTETIKNEELVSYYEAFRYRGFDREKMLKKLFQIAKDPKVAIQLILLCALNGPVRASQTKLLNGLTPIQMNIPASGQQQTENLSCARITSSTADVAAYYLKKLNVPKRLMSSSCPAYLQFPAAGSIKMNDALREQHIDFSKRFSSLIGGEFNESIYSQMMANAYLDSKLRLFD